MFSFHKPRVYRSATGCCICRAKSSSSRFTDSGRYEDDFSACFKLNESRTGDICNACVLLVKRWKKLPKESQRNWQHVVDARAGHGSKPLSKINKVKSNKPKGEMDINGNDYKKNVFIPAINRTREASPSGLSDDIQLEYLSSESGSYHSSLAASPVPSPGEEVDEDSTNVRTTCENNIKKGRRSRKRSIRLPRKRHSSFSSFLDLNFWKREKTCCGIIFKGPCGEVLLDRRFLSPCCEKSAEYSAVKGNSLQLKQIYALDSNYEEAFTLLASTAESTTQRAFLQNAILREYHHVD